MKRFILPLILAILAGVFASPNSNAQSSTMNDDGTYYYHTYDENWRLSQIQSGYLDNNLFIYPNPVVSQTRIELPYPSINRVYIQLIDLRGQIVRSFMYAPGSFQLDVDMSTVPIGLYNIRVIEYGRGDRTIQDIKVLKTN